MSNTATPETDMPSPPGALPKAEFVVLIASMMALNALAIDIMVPALNDIGAAFDLVRENDQQKVIFAYVLGFGAPATGVGAYIRPVWSSLAAAARAGWLRALRPWQCLRV